MTKASDIDIARALSCMCDGLAILKPGKEVLSRPAYAGQAQIYSEAAEQLKQAILEMKARLSTLDVTGVDLIEKMILTLDPDICAELPTGEKAPQFTLALEIQCQLIKERPTDFIFLCEYGLAPPDFRNGTLRSEEIFLAMAEMYHKAPSEELARAFRLWAYRGLSVAKIVFALREPGVVQDTGTAKIFADIIRDRVAADPLNAEQALSLMGARSDTFCVMAMMLAGTEPAETINTRRTSAQIINGFLSNHGRIAMERDYGPLERHLLEYDKDSFIFKGEPA
jgi:hypothetical protein